jgi:SET domain-containing protein
MQINIRKSKGKGRGVFANKKIRAGSVIEICPVLVLPSKDWKFIKHTRMGHYVFDWEKGKTGLAFGYGSLYNHSEKPNCGWRKDEDSLSYIATRTIQKGEEICISYGYKPKGYTESLDSGLKKSK